MSRLLFTLPDTLWGRGEAFEESPMEDSRRVWSQKLLLSEMSLNFPLVSVFLIDDHLAALTKNDN